jgi:hypothetical protein
MAAFTPRLPVTELLVTTESRKHLTHSAAFLVQGLVLIFFFTVYSLTRFLCPFKDLFLHKQGLEWPERSRSKGD